MLYFIAAKGNKKPQRKLLAKLIKLADAMTEVDSNLRHKFRENEDKLFDVNNYYLLNYRDNICETKAIINNSERLFGDSNFLNFTTLPFISGNVTQYQINSYISNLQIIWKQLKCEMCISSEVVFRRTMPSGNMQAKYMFIGEAPGVADGVKSFERAMGYGRTSNFLRKSIDYITILKDSWFSNVLKCSLCDNKKRSDRPFNNCYKNLLNEIEIIQPEQIFVLGKNAQNFLKKKLLFKFTKLHHPSYCLYKGINHKQYANIILKKINEQTTSDYI